MAHIYWSTLASVFYDTTIVILFEKRSSKCARGRMDSVPELQTLD